MEFEVTAKQNGNSVKFDVTCNDIKEALSLARKQAREIFDYKLGDEEPTVSVKPKKIKDEE